MHQIHRGHFAQQIEIAEDQRIFRDDADRLPRFERDFQALPRDAKPPFGRLITIGHARHDDRFRHPLRPREKRPQQRRRVVLDHDSRFEIQAGVEAQILMRRPGIAVRAAVGAAAIGIQAIAKRNIGTVVFRDDGLRLIGEILGFAMVEFGQQFFVVFALLEVGLDPNGFESVRQMQMRSAAFRVRFRLIGRHGD